jgi:hypothetical protein
MRLKGVLSMDYLTIEQGRVQSGLLLVLTRGVPGPWGEAAKALFRLHGLEFKPVQQLAGDPNLELCIGCKFSVLRKGWEPVLPLFPTIALSACS